MSEAAREEGERLNKSKGASPSSTAVPFLLCPHTASPSPILFSALADKRAAAPRPVAATSMPGLLGLLQSEWDALMLETFTLRKELDTTRGELSQALYQHDAACRVIARLVKERDAARAALSAAQASIAARVAAVGGPAAAAAPSAAMEDEGAAGAPEAAASPAGDAPLGLSEPLLAAIKDKHKELTRWRKKRAVPAEVAPAERVAGLAVAARFTPHSAALPGVTALAVAPAGAGPASLVLTGGADHTALLYDTAAERVVGRCEGGHSQRVTGVAFLPAAPGVVVTAGADGALHTWASSSAASEASSSRGAAEAYAPTLSLTPHRYCPGAPSIAGLTLHPLGHLAATCSGNGSWALSDLVAGAVLANAPDAEVAGAGAQFTCARFHPDGALLALGTSKQAVRIFDVRSQDAVATLADTLGGGISSVAFSENGWTMATGGSGDGIVRIYDLRTVKQVVEFNAGCGVSALGFDPSGLYLAAGTSAGGVQLWSPSPSYKDWAGVANLSGVHTGAVLALSFASDLTASRRLFTASADRSLAVLEA